MTKFPTLKQRKERNMNSETKWNSAGNTPREKTHTKHLLKYTYHGKPKGLHDYLHMYGFQTHRIQIYAKLRIAHIMLFCATYRTIETTDTTTIWRIMQCAVATSTVRSKQSRKVSAKHGIKIKKTKNMNEYLTYSKVLSC